MRFTSDEPFRTLVVHFFQRFFDTDTASAESVPRARLIQFLALITVVTPLLMILMIRGEQRVQIATGRLDFQWLQAGIHYTFVCYAMAVMGLVMTFKWDSLFPDRRDYLILTSLPISAKRLFAAKGIALGIVLSLFAVATNALLIILVGFMEPRAFVGHVTAVIGASIFAAFFFAALQGVLINLLTPSAFRRISPSIQMVAIALLATIVLAMPLIASSLRPLALINSPLLDYFPPVWFLGLYESLSSSAAIPQAGAWAWRAVEMTGLTALVMIVSYVVGYRCHSRKVLEAVDSDNHAAPRWDGFVKKALHVVMQTNAYQRAAFDFIGKISARSPKHRISAALYSGVALALAVSSLFVIDRREAFPIQLSKSGVLELPAALSFVVVAGWRATFGIPYELAANWVFQTTSRRNAQAFRKAIRKWLYVCRILPLYVLLAFFEFSWFDSRTATTHVLFDLITTAFLIEALFFGFRKIPYTCDYLQSKLQIAFFAVVYLYAYTTYKPLVGALKGWVSSDPRRFLQFLSVSAIAFGAILIYRALTGAEKSKFIYDEPDRAFQQLDLS